MFSTRMTMIDDRQDIARYLIQRGCKTDILMAAALGDIDLVRRHLDADPTSIRMCVSAEFFPMVSLKSGGTIYQWKLVCCERRCDACTENCNSGDQP